MPDISSKKSHKRALTLEYFTVGYNVIEGVLSVVVGLMAGSVALVGFGFDSAIESISGSVLIWRLRKHGRISEVEEERVERRAVKAVAVSFFILAAYILYESLEKLYFKEAPEPTLFGIAIALASLIIMPILSYYKSKEARKIESKALQADSKQTLICSYLSGALLLGLGANYLFGLWWADPVAALVIVVVIVREGVTTLREEKLCSC